MSRARGGIHQLSYGFFCDSFAHFFSGWFHRCCACGSSRGARIFNPVATAARGVGCGGGDGVVVRTNWCELVAVCGALACARSLDAGLSCGVVPRRARLQRDAYVCGAGGAGRVRVFASRERSGAGDCSDLGQSHWRGSIAWLRAQVRRWIRVYTPWASWERTPLKVTPPEIL